MPAIRIHARDLRDATMLARDAAPCPWRSTRHPCQFSRDAIERALQTIARSPHDREKWEKTIWREPQEALQLLMDALLERGDARGEAMAYELSQTPFLAMVVENRMANGLMEDMADFCDDEWNMTRVIVRGVHVGTPSPQPTNPRNVEFRGDEIEAILDRFGCAGADVVTKYAGRVCRNFAPEYSGFWANTPCVSGRDDREHGVLADETVLTVISCEEIPKRG